MFRFREMQMLNAVSGGTYMCVEMYRVANPKGYIDHLIKSGGWSANKINTNSKSLQMKRVALGPRMPAKLKNRVNFDARYIASETHLYIVTVWNRGGKNSIADSFISSIRLGPIDLSATGKMPTVTLDSLRAKTIRDIAGQLSKDERRLVPKNPKSDIEDPDSLIVLYRPWSGSVQPINNMLSKGKVSLKVTYGENGWITNVQHISGLTGNQSRNAFFSVLRSKFLPQEQDGKPISSDRKLDFQF